ncbi:Delta-aminolevulinic acid dehydratase [Leclercia adecarboxylata]|uniref:Delta-aminolevulinic acid dehydratase n=1 Tax=Leclercia adecarboxylata TaxID=83655 RepID=A0A4U9HM57_9ENTR|nr:Delta-aminolevulinic acid dehydratase [Leclercia adecarboxylata]
MNDLIARPRRLRKSPALRALFEETTLTLNDLVLPIFVEEEIDDYKAIDAMPGRHAYSRETPGPAKLSVSPTQASGRS